MGTAQATSIGFYPSPLIVASGSPLQLDLVISGVNMRADGTIPAGIPALGAWDLNVTFDPTILRFTSATFGTNLDVLGLGSIQSASLVTTGSINLFEISLDTSEDLESLQASNFTLTTLAFNAIGTGTSVLGIDINALSNADGGDSIAATGAPGSVTVNSLTPVPEPGTIWLFGFGLMALMLGCWRYQGKPRASGVAIGIVVLMIASSTQAAGVPLQGGDVLVGSSNGQIKHFSPDGTLLDTLDTGISTGETDHITALAFDTVNNLYAGVHGLAQGSGRIVKFDNRGNVVRYFSIGAGLPDNFVRSIVFDKGGNMLIGLDRAGGQRVEKLNSAGASVAVFTLVETFRPLEEINPDYIELRDDQCTLLFPRTYTYDPSNPSTVVRINRIARFDLCNNTQLFPDASGQTLDATVFVSEFRIRPNGEMLVVAINRSPSTTTVYRLAGGGQVALQSYAIGCSGCLTHLTLDPDNKSFWVTGNGGVIRRVDIATGTITRQFQIESSSDDLPIAVVGQIAVAALGGTPPSPAASTSYYVSVGSTQEEVCDVARRHADRQIAGNIDPDSVVILLFGRPIPTGTAGFNHDHQMPFSFDDIAARTRGFAQCYYERFDLSPGSRRYHVRIVIATSNNLPLRMRPDNPNNPVTEAHGRAWAQMVQQVALWVINLHLSGQIDIAAGSDWELNWNSARASRAWITGYKDAPLLPGLSALPFLYNMGDSVSCSVANGHLSTAQTDPDLPVGTPMCDNHWSLEDVWYVSWGADPAQVIPEIYTDGTLRNWKQVALFGVNHPERPNGGPMIMSGSLTQHSACFDGQANQADHGDCIQRYTPSYGFSSLWDTLNSDNTTKQILRWSTDMSNALRR